jgi:hypothetical protein
MALWSEGSDSRLRHRLGRLHEIAFESRGAGRYASADGSSIEVRGTAQGGNSGVLLEWEGRAPAWDSWVAPWLVSTVGGAHALHALEPVAEGRYRVRGAAAKLAQSDDGLRIRGIEVLSDVAGSPARQAESRALGSSSRVVLPAAGAPAEPRPR